MLALTIFVPFKDCGFSGSNIIYSILSLCKDRCVLICNDFQESIVNKYVSTVGNLQKFSIYCLEGSYSRHQMSVSYLHLEECFIQKRKETNCRYLFYNLCCSTYIQISMLVNKEQPTFNVFVHFILLILD